jgi:hypothetical protein
MSNLLRKPSLEKNSTWIIEVESKVQPGWLINSLQITHGFAIVMFEWLVLYGLGSERAGWGWLVVSISLGGWMIYSRRVLDLK